MSKKGQRFFASASLVVVGLIAGVMITQLGSAVAVTGQQARPAVNSGAPALDEAIPQGAFVRVAEQTQRALVYIVAEQTVSGDFFDRFFPDNPDSEDAPNRPDRVQPSQGSGFLISAAGYIVTNGHVVSRTDTNAVEVIRAGTVTVRLSNEDEYEAEIIGIDIGTDLAVLKIDAGYDLPYIPLGDSDLARVGEWVMALGAPFGLTNTVSAGIVSAKGRAPFGGPNRSAYQDFIQTDAAINPGNSGGPLVNLRGEVIGINTAIVSNSFQNQFSGVGFAIPINLVSGVVDQLIDHGRTIRGWLGISMTALDPSLAEAYGLDRRETRGAVHIGGVNEDEPADMSGVEVYDIVVGTNGVAIEDDQDLLQRIAMTPPDRTITLDIVRITPDDSPTGLARATTSIDVLLGERKPEIQVLADASNRGLEGIRLGRRDIRNRNLTAVEERFNMVLSELDRNLASELEYRADEGGIVILRAGDNNPVAARLRGNPTGTIIQKVNLRPINTIEAFAEIVDHFEPGQIVIFDLRLPNGDVQRVAIEIPE